jgi:translocation and assembly module TamA
MTAFGDGPPPPRRRSPFPEELLRSALHRLCGAVLAPFIVAASIGAAAPAEQAAARFSVEVQLAPELRALIEPHLAVWRERDDPQLGEERFRYLARSGTREIEQLLAAEGYFSPRVAYHLEQRDAGHAVVYTVDPGNPARVETVDVRISGGITADDADNRQRREQAVADWPLKPGVVFRSAQWEQAKQRLLAELHADRFPAARIVSSEAVVDPLQETVLLQLEVDSGPAFTFGDLEVTGLDIYPQRIVAGLNPIRPGSRYRTRDLLEFQEALQRTRYFASVAVSAPIAAEKPDRVPVQVRVVESTSVAIDVGLGYSTDTGFGIEARYTGASWLNPQWRTNGLLKLDQTEQLLSGELQLLPVFSNFIPTLTAEIKHTELQNQITTATALGARLTRSTPTSDLSYQLQFFHETKETGDAPSDSSNSLPLNISWTHRRLDNLLAPRRGFVYNVQLGGAIDGVITDQRFIRLYGKGSGFIPLGSSTILIARGEVGAVKADSRNGIPNDYLFRAGGSQSVRGYEYASLGVLDQGAIVPGRYLAVGSIELEQRVAEQWAIAVFYDLGNATDDRHDFKAVAGYGAGVRWRSPFGPLNVDLAYGENDRKLRLHFSFGYTF